ncbi:MAG: outer membrane lipoprotein carrier protein LolA [Prevotellaceae bacterium]|jgi:outer membrane lipoprotein-sorting protein|nr:outer membrane lipoprotein carrier protein LolA [Prevotellaceae bacterium]
MKTAEKICGQKNPHIFTSPHPHIPTSPHLHIIAFVLMFLYVAGVSAQNTKQLLADFTEKINGYQTIEMAFTLTLDNPVKGILRNYEGTLLCNGSKYRLLTEELEVYSDGRNKWMCNKETGEVIIQYVSDDETTADITDHPLKFLTLYQKDFTYKRKTTRTENGKIFADIVFTPKNKNAAYTSIVLTLEEATANPYAVKYLAKNGNYTLRITRITPNVEALDGYFAFPKHRYPGVEIIDLR